MTSLRAAAPWLAVPVAAIAIGGVLPEPAVATYVSWLLLAGTVLLAAPAIRVNEQGRQIARIRPLIARIETEKQRLSTLDPDSDAYRDGLADLSERQQRLTEIERELIGAKGTWSRSVHAGLYGGYGLILGAMVIRIAFP